MKRAATSATIDDSITVQDTADFAMNAVRAPVTGKCPALPPISGVVIGRLIGLRRSEVPLVDYNGNFGRAPLAAKSTVVVRKEQVGEEVALLFEGGDRLRPILIGFVQHPDNPATAPPKLIEVQQDGERVVLTADKELLLQCGEASITLTRAGKIVIRGKYVLSRSSGMNRIRGASVEIN